MLKAVELLKDMKLGGNGGYILKGTLLISDHITAEVCAFRPWADLRQTGVHEELDLLGT